MAKKTKVIDVWANDTNYDNVKKYEILPGGCLKIIEQDGDIHVFGPAVEWSLIERIEIEDEE
jgi:hypothetical protein